MLNRDFLYKEGKVMRKNVWKKLLLLMALVVALGGLTGMDSQGASKAKFSYKKVNESKTYHGKMTMKANVYYKKVVLKGKSNAVKKINKAIAKDCNRFLKSSTAEKIKEYASESAQNPLNYDLDSYDYYANSKVTYNKNGIISIRVTTFWFAGGVVNTDRYGLTYSLKTGKRLYLTNVCKGSSSTIKKTLCNKIKKDPDSDSMVWETINNYKVKKLNFYLKPGKKAVVCFGPYEINYGGWYRTFTIPSKYK